MTKWQYWSPSLIGAVLGWIIGLQIHGNSQGNPLVSLALLPLAYALTGAVSLQLTIFALQGLFAGVLPVPFGKSMRGANCRVIGLLLLLGLLVGLLLRVTGASEQLGPERHNLSWFWLIWFVSWAAFSGLSGPAALVIYLYSLPAAKPDFALDD